MRGSCLCGAVAFKVEAPRREVSLCHCTQCRRQSGHFWAASSVPLDRFRLTEDRGLRWYRASPAARRGFCRDCGAFLLWEPEGQGRMAFSPAVLDGPTGMSVSRLLHREDAGDYYDPAGGAPPAAAAPAQELHGTCLCGANRFTLPGPMGAVTACHCHQCRKTSGHYAARFAGREDSLSWQVRHIAEHVTPRGAWRGFCPDCGSKLWFRSADGAFAVEAGVIANPTGGHLARHVFVAEKGDYYVLADGVAQFPGAG